MRIRILIIAELSVFFAFVGCGSSPSKVEESSTESGSSQDPVPIAGVLGDDFITQHHIMSVFRSESIRHYVDSSTKRGCVFLVEAKDVERAKAILARDARRYCFYLRLKDEVFDGSRRSAWKTTRLNMSLADLLKQSEFTASTHLGRIMRSQLLTEDFGRYSFVVVMRILKREFLNSKRGAARAELSTEIGYEVELIVAESEAPTADGRRIDLQSWDGGHSVSLRSCNDLGSEVLKSYRE